MFTLQLRALEPEDLEVLYTIENDPELWDTAITDAPYSRFALRRYITESASISESRQLRLAIEVTDEEGKTEVVGMIDLTNYCPVNQRAEIGLAILRSYREKGYATEALMQIERFAQKRLHIHLLYAHIAMSNKPSLRLFSNVNYKRIAILPKWHFSGDEFEDTALFLKIFSKK